MSSIWKIVFIGIIFVVAVVSKGWADPEQIKIYKKVFPDSKPKCASCHVDEKPKKEDGKHDLNVYGLKVKAIDQKPTEETYKKAGSLESQVDDKKTK